MTDTLTRRDTVRFNTELLQDYLSQHETRQSDQANRTGLRLSSSVPAPPIRNGEDVPNYLKRIMMNQYEPNNPLSK